LSNRFDTTIGIVYTIYYPLELSGVGHRPPMPDFFMKGIIMQCPRCSHQSYVPLYSNTELKCLACGYEKQTVPLDILKEVEGMKKDPKLGGYIKKGYSPHIATQSRS